MVGVSCSWRDPSQTYGRPPMRAAGWLLVWWLWTGSDTDLLSGHKSMLGRVHSPSRQEQLVDLKISNLPLAHWKNQCLSIYSTNLYEGVKIPDLQINRFARILRAGGWQASPRWVVVTALSLLLLYYSRA